MPNALAFLALLAWPLVALFAFSRFRPQVALLVTYMGAMMFLPEKTVVDLPLEDFGKEQWAAAGALLGVLLVGDARRALWRAKPLRSGDIWIVLLMLGAFGTSRVNQEALLYGPTTLPSLTTWEAMSVAYADFWQYLVPYVLGRALFTTREDLKLLLRALQIASIIYVPFIVIELFLSPQLHNWVYGFAQHSFIQTIRAGGYRPMVFMGHGLALALLLSASVLAGVTLSLGKVATIYRIPGRYMSVLLLAVLVACKSLGAAIFATVFGMLLVFSTPKWQLRALVLAVAFIFLYPLSRASELFPERELIEFITKTFGADRAQSLDFRFVNEHDLAEHAAKKPMFGWGRYQRNMVFEIWSGQPVSTSDGHWIILYGVRGAWGFITFFAAMVAPIFVLRKNIKKLHNTQDRYLLVGLASILMIYTLDLIPNGLFTNFPLVLAGALLGLIRGIAATPQGDIKITVGAPGTIPTTKS